MAENQIQTEVKKFKQRFLIIGAVAFVLILGSIGLGIYLLATSNRIYVDTAVISAPVISLSPQVGGSLQETFVSIGDVVPANSPVARTGNELIKSKDSGLILSIRTDIGTIFAPGMPVATMINPYDLRIVASVTEDKGLSQIKVGQSVIFTVDAFGSKKYYGIIDEISPTARQGDIVFNISNTRQEQQFDVKVRFDVNQYPELKNGMSAKIWIYK
jgi:multidrug resistance efflux pump